MSEQYVAYVHMWTEQQTYWLKKNAPWWVPDAVWLAQSGEPFTPAVSEAASDQSLILLIGPVSGAVFNTNQCPVNASPKIIHFFNNIRMSFKLKLN